jgi:hypothetical protein
MPFKGEPKWVSREPVKSADAEFYEALMNDPFVGATAVDALARFIKATDELRAAPRSRVTPEAATKLVIARIVYARDAALAASDPTYEQIFEGQLQGWEAAARIVQGRAAPQEAPTQTGTKRMSDGKIVPAAN